MLAIMVTKQHGLFLEFRSSNPTNLTSWTPLNAFGVFSLPCGKVDGLLHCLVGQYFEFVPFIPVKFGFWLSSVLCSYIGTTEFQIWALSTHLWTSAAYGGVSGTVSRRYLLPCPAWAMENTECLLWV